MTLTKIVSVGLVGLVSLNCLIPVCTSPVSIDLDPSSLKSIHSDHQRYVITRRRNDMDDPSDGVLYILADDPDLQTLSYALNRQHKVGYNLDDELEHIEQLNKDQLDEEIKMLEKEKLLIEDLEKEEPDQMPILSEKIDLLMNETEPVNGTTPHISVVSPIKTVIGLFGELLGVVANKVGSIVSDTIDLAKQVSESEPFNSHMTNVTRSVNTLVEESAGLFNKVVEIKYSAGDKVISRINTSIKIRNKQKKKLDEEETLSEKVKQKADKLNRKKEKTEKENDQKQKRNKKTPKKEVDQ